MLPIIYAAYLGTIMFDRVHRVVVLAGKFGSELNIAVYYSNCILQQFRRQL